MNDQQVNPNQPIDESAPSPSNSAKDVAQDIVSSQKPLDSHTKAVVSDGQAMYSVNDSYIRYKAEVNLSPDKRSAEYKFFPNMSLPSTTRSGYDKSVSQFQNRRSGDTDAQWVRAYVGGAGAIPPERWNESVLNNESSEWSTSLEYQGVNMAQATSKKTPAGELRGTAAVDAVLRKNNRPGTSRMPLWHSGFWLYYRPMNGQDISDLMNAIASAKALIGINTYGRAFATDTAYIDKVVLQFFFDRCVTTSSIATDDTNFDYLNHILLPDKNVIYGYLMSKCFPTGFAYSRACLSPGCGNISEGLLDLEQIVRVDRSRFTDYQKEHMFSMGDGSTSLETVKKYQEEFKWVNRTFEQNEVIYKVSIPTLRSYIDSSNAYLDNIHSMYTEAMYEDPKERAAMLKRAMNATTCNQYAHYITEITVENNTDEGVVKSYIKETSTIALVLESLSTDSIDVRNFIRHINKASADSVIALCAITSYKCKSCGTWQNEKDSEHAQVLIPIDPLSTFFTLASQVIQEQQTVATNI